MDTNQKVKTLTVGQLIEKLQKLDPDMPVFARAPAHDYWRNQLALQLSNPRVESVRWSDYHDNFQVIDEDRRQESFNAVVLR